MNPKQKTLAMVISGALIAIAPSFFGYLQARHEIKEKYNQNRAASEAGYAALVKAVDDLQKNAVSQHEYVVKLEGRITALTELLARTRVRVTSIPTPPTRQPEDENPTAGSGAGSGSAARVDGDGIPDHPAPPKPNFERPPRDLTAAQRPTLPHP